MKTKKAERNKTEKTQKSDFIVYLFILSIGYTLKSIVSLHSFSGENKPPMFGDYEAQRHWQEVSVNLPVSEWYKNSTENDLLYWGLDYPPLTAYHSLVLGRFATYLNESYVRLHDSRGIGSKEHKSFMRTTVLIADLFLLFPSIIFLVQIMKKNLSEFNKANNRNQTIQLFALLIFHPGLTLIDNGHFQYNNISLALTMLAIGFILKDSDKTASFFFCLALCYKQMSLYYSLTFFVYLLRKCFPSKHQRFSESFLKLISLGIIVVCTFALLFLPWLTSLEDLLQVIRRIFPINRGLFEDKVANFWCSLNVVIKIRNFFSNETLAKICMISTLLSSLPSLVHLFIKPSKEIFLYSLANVSLGFFLFSYQVHEKSILLPTVPILILHSLEDFPSYWFMQIALFSMYPLLEKDGLGTAFFAISLLTIFVRKRFIKDFPTEGNSGFKSIFRNFLHPLSILVYAVLILLHRLVSPPKRYPDLFPLLIASYSFMHFFIFYIYFNYKQFKLTKKLH